jgi:hypothetical protein
MEEKTAARNRYSVEQLWSQGGAIIGNHWQMFKPQKRQNQAITVAVACDQLSTKAHGKEGVHGSSP